MPGIHVLIYTTRDSPRMSYVLDWLFKEQLGLSYRITSDNEDTSSPYTIGYGNDAGTINVFAANLLSETGTKPQNVRLDSWQQLHVLYSSGNSNFTVPFDLFSAIFYLLSRYEEYLGFTPDKHQRFPHTSSVLQSVLQRPIVDEWVEYFRRVLEEQWGISMPRRQFSIELTYDIDIAWAYRNKGLKRTIGAVGRDILDLQFGKVAGRIGRDPYDSFEWIQGVHRRHSIKPKYFILAAHDTTEFDKNISPRHPSMRLLIDALGKEGEVGIHPSYYTANDILKQKEEKGVLEEIIDKPITISRQHYIRLKFPQTYRQLIATGITDDYSMGYSTHFGFRAGTSQSFYWYDVDREKTTGLRVHPFCFMDTTARFDMGLSPEESYGRLEEMVTTLKKTGGNGTVIFHNFSLGTDKGWTGWKERYEDFVTRYEGLTSGS